MQNEIGLMHATESVLSGALATLQTREAAYQAARTARVQAFGAQQTQDELARGAIRKASNVLRNALGNHWSEVWEETGFPSRSTAVPGTLAERLALLRSLQMYFAAHPAREVASQGVTAAQFEQLYNSLAEARSAVNACRTDAEEKRLARDTAEADLRKRMLDLVVELSRLISGSDPRWKRFGLKSPDAPEAPETPRQVVVSNNLPGRLLVTCAAAVRAEFYRFWAQEAGSAEAPVAVGTAGEPTYVLEGLAPGKSYNVFVSAVNSGGESERSAPAGADVLALAA